MFLGIRWGSLSLKLFAWSFVPAAVILLTAVVFSAWAFELTAGEAWADLTHDTRRIVQLLLTLLALGVILPALVVSIGVRRVTRPIHELIEASQEVARGNFGHTIAADTGDEIEELARQFNTMSAELAASYAHLERRVSSRTQALEAKTAAEHRRAEQFRLIAEIGRRMTSILPVPDLLSQIVRLIQETFDYHHVGIGLVEGDEVVYRAGAGALWDNPDFDFLPARLKIGQEGVSGWVAFSGQSMLLPDVAEEPRYVLMEGSGTRSELAVPLKSKGEVIGVLDLQSDRTGAFDGSDLIVMQSLAHQAAIAIENARLYERARRLAVLEERQRVARDLHDSVTQSLYGVTLYADAAARLLTAGDQATAADHLRQLRETAQEALQEMRLLIFELRPPKLEEVGLVAALQARLDAVEGRAGVRASLEADSELRAPPVIEAAMYRIAQEALNNTLRHAHASTVVVSLRREGVTMILEVADDGIGFDPVAAREGGGLGLRGMAERVHDIGGEIRFDSAPSAGTRVTVEVLL